MVDQIVIADTEMRKNCAVITIVRQRFLDETVTNQLHDQILEALNKNVGLVVVDYCNVQYIDSVFIGKMSEWKKESNKRQKAIRFCNLSDELYEVLLITKTSEEYYNYASVEAAIQDQK